MSTRQRLLEAGLGPRGLRPLLLLGVLSVAKGLALVLVAESLARGIGALAAGDDGWRLALAFGAAGAVLRALTSWGAAVAAARVAVGAQRELRRELLDRELESPSGSQGAVAVLAGPGLDGLDGYYREVLPAVVSAAVIPLMVGLRILGADWLSAVVLLVTVPLVPVFMALVGMHSRDRTDAALTALERLSGQLVELARGLPVLVGLGRVEEQTAQLRALSDEHRTRTLATLRIAFLSSLVLELIATISVAVVAVLIGLRLLNGQLDLSTGLLVLILAPECFAPLRDVGAAFHAAQDGLAVLRRVRVAIARPHSARVVVVAEGIQLEALEVRYPGQANPALAALSATLPRHGVSAITGPSGSGKSTLLAVLAGLVRDGEGEARVTGRASAPAADRVAWLAQDPHTVAETVLAELRAYAAPTATPTQLATWLDSVGLLAFAASDPATLSPGELRRLAFARVLARVDAGAELVLLDEPTAHLDTVNRERIERLIVELGERATVLLASHEPGTLALADHRVAVGDERMPAAADLARTDLVRTDAPSRADPEPASADRTAAAPLPPTSLASLLRPAAVRFTASVLVGTLAVGLGMSLTAVSAWLIVRASEHPDLMYLSVAIVGVRFFGLGRSVARYLERLLTHDAVFAAVSVLRVSLWSAIAERGLASRALLRPGAALEHLVVSLDELRDLVPRVVVPIGVGVLGSAGVLLTVGLIDAPSLPVVGAVVLLGLAGAPLAAVAADRAASRTVSRLKVRSTRLLSAALSAAPDLVANGVAGRLRDRLVEVDGRTGAAERRAAVAAGLGSALVALATVGGAVLVPALRASAVAAGVLTPESVAVVALLTLALFEPLGALTAAAQRLPALREVRARISPVLEPVPPIASGTRTPGALRELEVRGLAVAWPSAAVPAFKGLDARAVAGDWLVVEGPSGSGKSTLLAALLRYLPPASGRYELDQQDVAQLDTRTVRSRIAWCPQDAHVFDSTLRGNLLLARSRDDRPSNAELEAVLGRVGLSGLLADGPGLDRRVGAGGSWLSGGERQRLAVARALLARADVILLDEPTAHLDEPTARAMMHDIRRATSEKLVVLVTHRAADRREGDVRVELGVQPAMTASV